ncbi:hypothetical protein D3C71_1145650 [compost metagenome]
MGKVTFFSSDESLVDLLSSESDPEDNKDTGTTATSKPEDEDAVIILTKEPTVNTSVVAQTASDDIVEDSFLEMPQIIPNVDNLKMQLEMKNRLVEQKNVLISEAKKDIDDLYRLQEAQLLEMRGVYEGEMRKANDIIETLRKDLEASSVPENVRGFMKYATYAMNSRTAHKEELAENKANYLSTLKSPFYVFATSCTPSSQSYFPHLQSLINSGKSNAVYVDFTGDMYLRMIYKMRSGGDIISSLRDLDNNSVDSKVHQVGDSHIIVGSPYNDIALLTLDFDKIIRSLDRYANGRPVFLLFNSINSFSSRFTVSKLGSVFPTSIFTKIDPAILSTLFSNLNFIPHDRYSLVILDYKDELVEMKDILTQFKTDRVILTKTGVNWKELGVKVKG